MKQKAKIKLFQIFLEEHGKPSIKRITGFSLIANGLIGKNILAISALLKTIDHYNDIDNTFDGLIYGGIENRYNILNS